LCFCTQGLSPPTGCNIIIKRMTRRSGDLRSSYNKHRCNAPRNPADDRVWETTAAIGINIIIYYDKLPLNRPVVVCSTRGDRINAIWPTGKPNSKKTKLPKLMSDTDSNVNCAFFRMFLMFTYLFLSEHKSISRIIKELKNKLLFPFFFNHLTYTVLQHLLEYLGLLGL
jgi:hypothetical protein